MSSVDPDHTYLAGVDQIPQDPALNDWLREHYGAGISITAAMVNEYAATLRAHNRSYARQDLKINLAENAGLEERS